MMAAGLLTLAANAMHLEANKPSCVLVVIMQNLHLSTKAPRSLIFSLSEGSSRFFAVYGSAGFEPVSVFEKEDILLLSANGCQNPEM